MKRNFFRIVLMAMLVMISFSSNTVFTFAETIGEQTVGIQPRVGGSGVVYMEQKVSEKLSQSRTFITWHPDFSSYKRNVSLYFFYNSSASVNVSVGGQSVSISYNPSSNGSGYGVASNPAKASRPAIYGDIYNVTYKVGRYNVNTKKWLSSSNVVRKQVKNTYVAIRYQ